MSAVTEAVKTIDELNQQIVTLKQQNATLKLAGHFTDSVMLAADELRLTREREAALQVAMRAALRHMEGCADSNDPAFVEAWDVLATALDQGVAHE